MIKLENLSITYPLRRMNAFSLRARVAYALGRLFGLRVANPRHYVEALCGANLTINNGDKLGVIGYNGAGKTTFLRAVSGTYPPTSGRVQIDGTVTSLIDTTLGMDMEATGERNIFLKLVYQGKTFAQAKAATPAIVKLVELGEAINEPIYTYSTGMILRLAFVIATFETPEILIMDEIIGAGDEKFRARIENRLNEIIDDSKICIICSHDMEAIRKFCNRCILLVGGKIIADGDVEEVIQKYHANIADND